MAKRLLVLLLSVCICYTHILAGIVEGVVTETETGEPLIGASVNYENGEGVSTDGEGRFSLNLPNGKYSLTIRYIGFKTVMKEIEVTDEKLSLTISLEEDNATLGTVIVIGETRRNTDAVLIYEQQESHVVMTSVSEQHIKRTQDKDASEVIRRIPGVSIIDEKFVMVRGLSQRYNNVWMNGCAVPSSEADQRAFSFDIIPSSQIDNMKVVKSAAPEYPADFTGGFIMVNTKDVPVSNSWNIGLGGSINEQTHFKEHFYYKGSPTDFLGFDNGKRNLDNGIHTTLHPQCNGYSLLNNGLSNDWTVHSCKPISDITLSGSISQRWHTAQRQTFGLNGSINYSNSYRTLTDVANNLFGAYDVTHDRSNYLRRATDNQYTNNVRLGGLLGLIWLTSDNKHRIEMKQIFNQLGKNRYTFRHGYDAQSDYTQQAEYYYQSRLTYNIGLQGKHTLSETNLLDWNFGYAFANRNTPDRHRYITVRQDDNSMEIENLNDINREFSYLSENIFSGGTNWRHDFGLSNTSPSLKVGAYGEYKSRNYNTRFFTYAWPFGQLPQQMRVLDVPTQLLTDANYGQDGLYLLEQVDWTNNYKARNTLGCGYASLYVPLFAKRLEVYGGMRFETFHTELISHTQRLEYSPLSTRYDYNDFFPSLNLKAHISAKQQLRISYGRTTNRPEFRELSTSVYYDFDLASNVQGNHNLNPAYIDNVDLGWEWYPNAGELISISCFYKHFKNPIEWTYTVAGGTDLVYSYMNAESTDNYGIELDIRKQFDFLHLPQFSLSLNAALIHSSVNFPADSREKDRPMQGQSPYLVNAGIFYNSDLGKLSCPWQKGWTAALLYNIIGKRIIGVGRSVGNGEVDVRVPDSYEMPRHQIDLNISKSFGRLDFRISVHDLLAQKNEFKQFEHTLHGEIQQVTRSYKTGRTFSLVVNYKM